MAVSYVSQTPFVSSPYVAPVDLNIMAKVLQQKQGQYDANYQKIQGQLSTIASLDMIRDVDKQYRDQKLNNITNQLNNFTGVDLSDPNISNQIDSYASSIYKDDNILKAISSTRSIRSLQTSYEKIKSDPKLIKYYSDANYTLDNEEINRYVGSKDISDSYRGKSDATLFSSYIPELQKAITQLKAEKATKLSDGTIGYHDTRTDEWLSEERIKELAAASLDTNQQAQMGRDGNYFFKYKSNYSPEQLVGRAVIYDTQKLNTLNSQLKDANQALSLESDPNNKKYLKDVLIPQLNKNISVLDGEITKKTKYYTQLGENNIYELRSQIYANETYKGLASAYSYTRTDIKSEVDKYKLAKYNNDLQYSTSSRLLSQRGRQEENNLILKARLDASTKQNEIDPSLSFFTMPTNEGMTVSDKNLVHEQEAKAYGQLFKNHNDKFDKDHGTINGLDKARWSLSNFATKGVDPTIKTLPKDLGKIALKADILNFAERSSEYLGLTNSNLTNQYKNFIIDPKIDKSTIAFNIKSRVLSKNIKGIQDLVKDKNNQLDKISSISFTGVHRAKTQYTPDANGNYIRDNQIYVTASVNGKELEIPIDENEARALNQNYYKLPEEYEILEKSVTSNNHFTSVLQHPKNNNLLTQITIAKLSNGRYDAYYNFNGTAIPVSSFSTVYADSKFDNATSALIAAEQKFNEQNNSESFKKLLSSYEKSASYPTNNIKFLPEIYQQDVKKRVTSELNKRRELELDKLNQEITGDGGFPSHFNQN